MTAATVVLCRCGHAERMHERDTAAEHDRGECRQGSCGCSEFRPDDGSPVAPTAPLASVPSLPVEKPDTATDQAPIEPEPVAVQVWRCEPCAVDFETPQARGSHNRYKHSTLPKPDTRPGTKRELPEAAKQGSPSQPSSSAAEPSDESAADALADTLDAEPSPVPAVTKAQPIRAVVDHRTIEVEFEAGSLTLRYDIDWARLPFAAQSCLMDLTSVLFRLGHVDHFAAVIGDPNGDDFAGEPVSS